MDKNIEKSVQNHVAQYFANYNNLDEGRKAILNIFFSKFLLAALSSRSHFENAVQSCDYLVPFDCSNGITAGEIGLVGTVT